MLKNQQNMIPDDFEALLLQTIVSGYNTDKELQKTIDMNANYVYSMPISLTIGEKTDAKIAELLNKGKKTIPYYLKITIYLALTIITGLFIYNLSLNNEPVNVNNSNKNILPPVLTEVDTTENADSVIIDDNNFSKLTSAVDSLVTKNEIVEIVSEEKDSSKVETTFAVNTSVPKQFSGSGYHDDFDLDYAKELLKNKPEVKIYPGEYVLDSYATNLSRWYDFLIDLEKKDTLILNSIKNKNTFMLPVYCGVPFKKGFENCTYIALSDKHKEIKTGIQENISSISLPEGLRYYFNESLLTDSNTKLSSEEIDKLQPFYISNTEVSNFEYKDFLYSILKDNGYDKIKIDSTLSESDMRYFVYTFRNPNAEIQNKFGSSTINIFPKTNCWTDDNPYSYQEPMNKYYFFHPAYEQYPVVGISYWQALAYLDWLTWVWQTRLDEQGIPYEIQFDLPQDFEWEMAGDEVLKYMGIDINSDDIICDLDLIYHNNYNYTKTIGNRNNGDKYDFVHSSPVNNGRSFSAENKTGILNLNGNVSEWIKEDYSKTWAKYRQKNIELLKGSANSGDKILLLTEEYFDSTHNNRNGKMVRGLNWFDNRQIDRTHFISKAIFAKCFVNPDEQHSTLGFRYVVRVRLKDQDKALKKIEILGRNMPQIDYSLLKVKYTKHYAQDPEGFSFIPPGSFVYKDTTTTVQGFWAQQTEVSNLTWMIFLNYLIENNLDEDLSKCIPNDPEWKIKMNMETDTILTKSKIDKLELYKFLPFPKEFVANNKIKDIPVTYFAFKPVVGISHEAAEIFALWLSKMNRTPGDFYKTFRLASEVEWEYMAQAGTKNTPYAWGGPYTRNYQGLFLAKFKTSSDIEKDVTIDSITYHRMDENKMEELFKNQNSEFTSTVPDANWSGPNGPLQISNFPANGWGLYDMCGNVAEMIQNPNKTKGGSWASSAFFIQINSEEKWSGKPSDCVGFRLVQTYIGGGAE